MTIILNQRNVRIRAVPDLVQMRPCASYEAPYLGPEGGKPGIGLQRQSGIHAQEN